MIKVDKRTNKDTDEYPMAVCFTINRKRYYHKLVDMPFQKEKYFNEVCSVTSSRSSLMSVQKEWQDILDSYREKLVKLQKNQELTLDVIKAAMSGVTSTNVNPLSFVGVWEELIKDYRRNGQVGTAENYQWALNSWNKLDMYPLEIRFKNNEKLLNINKVDTTNVDVDKMTPDEMKEFIKKMIGK